MRHTVPSPDAAKSWPSTRAGANEPSRARPTLVLQTERSGVTTFISGKGGIFGAELPQPVLIDVGRAPVIVAPSHGVAGPHVVASPRAVAGTQ